MTLKETIIKNALEIFAEKGYAKATISEICKKSNTSKGGFYHHFSSKDEILDEITQMYFSEILQRYESIISNEENDSLSMLENVFQTVNAYKQEQFSKWDTLTKLYGHRDSHIVIRKLADNFERVTADIHLKLIERGVERNEFKVVNPKALSVMWSSMLIELYSKINQIVASPKDEALISEFKAFAVFLEETINFSIKDKSRDINVVSPASDYLDLVIEQLKIRSK